MTVRPNEVAGDADNPLLKTPTSGQNITRTLSPLSGETLYEKRFDTLFREVIKPALLRVVGDYVRLGKFPRLDVVEGGGPTKPSDNNYFVDNMRVILDTRPWPASLWFVAWEPSVLIQNRRGAAGPLQTHRLEEVTPQFVEITARAFLDSI